MFMEGEEVDQDNVKVDQHVVDVIRKKTIQSKLVGNHQSCSGASSRE